MASAWPQSGLPSRLYRLSSHHTGQRSYLLGHGGEALNHFILADLQQTSQLFQSAPFQNLVLVIVAAQYRSTLISQSLFLSHQLSNGRTSYRSQTANAADASSRTTRKPWISLVFATWQPPHNSIRHRHPSTPYVLRCRTFHQIRLLHPVLWLRQPTANPFTHGQRQFVD